MNDEYPLHYKDWQIGIVEVFKCGLYYMIKCRFQPDSEDCFHLMVDCGGKNTDLGLCAQYGPDFGLERYLPISRIGAGRLHFWLKNKRKDDIFIKVSDTEPFLYIPDLMTARFSVRSGQKGVLLEKISR